MCETGQILSDPDVTFLRDNTDSHCILLTEEFYRDLNVSRFSSSVIMGSLFITKPLLGVSV